MGSSWPKEEVIPFWERSLIMLDKKKSHFQKHDLVEGFMLYEYFLVTVFYIKTYVIA